MGSTIHNDNRGPNAINPEPDIKFGGINTLDTDRNCLKETDINFEAKIHYKILIKLSKRAFLRQKYIRYTDQNGLKK